MEGWIKLHRKFLKWEWFSTDNMVRIFLYLLLSANHESKKWKGLTIERGQLVTGRKTLAKETGMSEQNIRTCLVKLKSTGEITNKPTNKYTIITLCNYDTYQNLIIDNNQQTNQLPNQQLTNNQPTTNQQLTTNKNVKNKKNVKNDKNKIKNLTKGKKLFKNSGVTIQDIEDAFKKTEDLINADPKHYFNRMLDASESKGIMNIDWIATARSWARRDLAEDKLVLLKIKSKNITQW